MNERGRALNTKNKIRLGLIGASLNGSNWSSLSHLPALQASDDFELTAVCTTKADTAEAARQAYGAKLAFDDYRKMVASPDIDAVAVVVRVPSHYGPAKAALDAGKHVYCEWPLGRTTHEAEELSTLAQSKGVVTAVGLQARVNPGLKHLKKMLADGYVGEPLGIHVSMMRHGALRRSSSKMWQRDASLGANTLTILNGHATDTLRFIAGDFATLSANVTTQAKQWYETDTKRFVDVTSPDTVLVSGMLRSGVAASLRAGLIPFAGSGLRIEIYGHEGTILVEGSDSPQLCPLNIKGARGGHELRPIEISQENFKDENNNLKGKSFNVGEMYSYFSDGIRGKGGEHPTFQTAVELHRILDKIKLSSDTKKEVNVND